MKKRILITSFVILSASSISPACRAEDGHSVRFLPSYYKCAFDAKGEKSCTCFDNGCNITPCPTDDPPPWKHRPVCPEGENCAEYPGDYACRLEPHGKLARPVNR